MIQILVWEGYRPDLVDTPRSTCTRSRLILYRQVELLGSSTRVSLHDYTDGITCEWLQKMKNRTVANSSSFELVVSLIWAIWPESVGTEVKAAFLGKPRTKFRTLLAQCLNSALQHLVFNLSHGAYIPTSRAAVNSNVWTLLYAVFFFFTVGVVRTVTAEVQHLN